MPDYTKMCQAECKTKIDYWLYVLANMETMTSEMPFQKERPIFGKVENISQLINMSAEELTLYNISLDAYRTNLSAMRNERKEGREEGLKEGREEGLKEGREKKSFETAHLMLQDGESIDKIIRYTGLTKEQVESLK